MTPEEQIAQEFATTLENDPAAKISFLTANCQNFTWLQCPPYEIEPVDFWQYGPPIPEAPDYIYLLAETWYHSGWGGWVIRFPPKPAAKASYEFDQAKDIVEMRVAEKWGPTKSNIISKSPPSHPLPVLDLGKTIIFDPEANKGSVSLEPAREPDPSKWRNSNE
jgi:hypothetical protein